MNIGSLVDVTNGNKIRQTIGIFFFLTLLVASYGGDFVLIDKIFSVPGRPTDEPLNVPNRTMLNWLFAIQVYLFFKLFTIWSIDQKSYEAEWLGKNFEKKSEAKANLDLLSELVEYLRNWSPPSTEVLLKFTKGDFKRIDAEVSTIAKSLSSVTLYDEHGRVQKGVDLMDGVAKKFGMKSSEPLTDIVSAVYDTLKEVAELQDQAQTAFSKINPDNQTELFKQLRKHSSHISRSAVAKGLDVYVFDLFLPAGLCLASLWLSLPDFQKVWCLISGSF